MYLTPQHVLLAGATGLTGEHLLDRLLNEPTITRVLAPPAGRWRNIRTWKTRWATRGVSAATERPRRYRLSAAWAPPSSRRAPKLPRGGPGHGGGLRQTRAGNGRAAPDRDQRLGADPKSSIFYNRVKGEMEQALRAQDWPQLTICRPSLLLGERTEPRLAEQLAAPFSA
jgi:nucleoside-diphosphate-sugar epimerase